MKFIKIYKKAITLFVIINFLFLIQSIAKPYQGSHYDETTITESKNNHDGIGMIEKEGKPPPKRKKKSALPYILAAVALAVVVVFVLLKSKKKDKQSVNANVINDEPKKKILVDASRDGGVWWYPQGSNGNPDLDHQGKAFVDYLKSRGFSVNELSRPTQITSDLLSGYDIVIRANQFGTYSNFEIDAYHNYLSNGGKLLLLSEFNRSSAEDSLALSFGLSFVGISRGENIIAKFKTHPITKGVDTVKYKVGSGVMKYPNSATILGYLSEETYIDLNYNSVKDTGEPSGAPVLGVMPYKSGWIVFCGDTNMWQWVPQPLVKNTIDWLMNQ